MNSTPSTLTAPKPISTDFVLTREGRRRLIARIRTLRDDVIPGLAALRDDSDGINLENELQCRQATQELAELRKALKRSARAEQIPDDPQLVEVGEVVTVEFYDGNVDIYWIVNPVEARLGGSRRISTQSPLGAALLGSRVGEVVEVAAPGGSYECTIKTSRRVEQRMAGNTRGPA